MRSVWHGSWKIVLAPENVSYFREVRIHSTGKALEADFLDGVQALAQSFLTFLKQCSS
jgi:hypothetical protein